MQLGNMWASFLLGTACFLAATVSGSPMMSANTIDASRMGSDSRYSSNNNNNNGMTEDENTVITRWRPFNFFKVPPQLKNWDGLSGIPSEHEEAYFPLFRTANHEQVAGPGKEVNVHNLNKFVNNLKTRLRDEFSALLALSDAEEAFEAHMMASSTFPGLKAAGHPTIIGSGSRHRRFLPKQLI